MSKSLDDQDVVSLYKQAAVEEPPVELDDKILRHANRTPTVTWYKYVALAATIGFVAILLPKQLQNQVDIEPFEHSNLMQKIEAPPAMKQQKKQQVELNKRMLEERVERQSTERRNIVAPDKAFESERQELEMFVDSKERDNNPFSVVNALLEKGDRAKAKQELQLILQQQPSLRDTLPDDLQKLLSEKDN